MLTHDLQCSLPALLHIQMSSLDALIVSEVHPFGEIFFEVRPHWLVRGPALQNRHRGGESTRSGGENGIVWHEAKQADNFFILLINTRVTFGILRIPTGSSPGPHSRLRRETQDKVSHVHTEWCCEAVKEGSWVFLTGTYRWRNCPGGGRVWCEQPGLGWRWSHLCCPGSLTRMMPYYMKPPPCLRQRRKY